MDDNVMHNLYLEGSGNSWKTTMEDTCSFKNRYISLSQLISKRTCRRSIKTQHFACLQNLVSKTFALLY